MTHWHIPEADIAAILATRHPDPFAVLGPHETPAGLVIRALVPGAAALTVLDLAGASLAILECRTADGFFEGLVPDRPTRFSYRLRAENQYGTWTLQDPYAFSPVLGSLDDHLLVEGTHRRLYERLGAHPMHHDGADGTHFAVWAPNASRVSVVGDFNAWDGRRHQMRKRIDSGLWEIFAPEVGEGTVYKYEIISRDGHLLPLKADPFGFAAELRPSTASVVARTDNLPFADADWLAHRTEANKRRQPISIYEVHLGSWRRRDDGGFLSYDELAETLIPYAADLGFTHLELMPVTEHPLDDSWGYQPIGLFAATARFGDPAGFARFVDRAHRAGLGIILDWVPAHFPTDVHGLSLFDGQPLYEHADPRRGFHPEWNTAIYDFGRLEVANFLIASAAYWLDRFHIDGLRVDGVASMLYLDYSRRAGEWAPNPDGSNDNRDAAAFIRRCNTLLYGDYPGTMTIAEESTAWGGVSAPTDAGGLGFGFKWNMGWMHDTLEYMAEDPVHRRWHHHKMTFGLLYAWTENFVLPLSHDEVVYGKGSILGRMPGDEWQRFANLRAYYGFMWGQPGKKLLFMGQEFGQSQEWDFRRGLEWWLLDHDVHRGVKALLRDLNHLYREQKALHVGDCESGGFRWIVPDDTNNSVYAWLRFAPDRPAMAPAMAPAVAPPVAPPMVPPMAPPTAPTVAMASNFTPVPREGYRIGLPFPGRWRQALNTDAPHYGGSGFGDREAIEAVPEPSHGLPASATIQVPPLATVYFIHDTV